MKRRVRTILEYLSAFVLIFLLLVAIAGVVVVKFYGDDLKVFAMEQINMRLDSKVDVEELTVKVFHKFPYSSIHLENIIVWSSHNFNTLGFPDEGADTLLHAQSVNVSFNLFSLLRKRYNMHQLELKEGTLHLFTDARGEINYKIRANHQEEGKGEQQINLSQVKIVDVEVVINNQSKQLLSRGEIKKLDLNGRFSKRKSQLRGNMTGRLGEVSNKGIRYASDREIEAKLNLDVQDSLFNIKSGQLQIDRIVADMDGQFIIHQNTGVELNLFATAMNLEIHEVLDLLPSEISNSFLGIRGNGILQLYARITGMVNSTLTPGIEADFQTSNANLTWGEIPFAIKSLNLNGTYSNGGQFNPITTSLIIESFSANIGQDHLSMSGHIHNFFDPDFSFKLKGDIHPEQWLAWYTTIPIHSASGTIISDIKVSGTYDRLKPRGEKLLSFDFSGGLSLEDVTLLVQKNSIPFTKLNGTVQIDNDFWEPSFSGFLGKSDFQISGSGLNLISFLMKKDEHLLASATLKSEQLDLQEIINGFANTNNGNRSSIFFPEGIDLKLGFGISHFSMNNFKADNLRGMARYESPFFYVDSLIMQTMEGTLRGEYGMAQDLEGIIYMNVDASLYNLDIQQLFYSFNNFGQEQLTDEHLKGIVSGKAMFSADFDSTFTIRPESILSETNITIRKGELNAFSPIMALSRFVEVEELQNIKFETLENNILIKENQVIIPAMDIHSNALNLSASGTHAFTNHYDYRLKLKLSELLYSKSRGAGNSEFQIAEDESDHRTLFLKVYNNGAGAQVELDREKTAQKIRNDLKDEKKELKKILQSELGLFNRNDSATSEKEKPGDEESGFRFEFPEDKDTITTKKNEEKSGWLRRRTKKDTTQNKPAAKFVIDE